MRAGTEVSRKAWGAAMHYGWFSLRHPLKNHQVGEQPVSDRFG